jgi:hypothetical protein
MLKYLTLSIPGARSIERYEPCKTLLMYGWGGREQQRAHKLHEGHYACLDLGFWSKTGEGDRHWRVSIDGWHCPDKILHGATSTRFDRYGFTVQEAGGNPDGPILVIGTSQKSQRIEGPQWAQRKIRQLRRQTNKPIWYKFKPGRPPDPVPADKIVGGDIFDVLPKVSMVVCRHSNVAVDATFMGVPVVCEDGAGAAIYPKSFWGQQPSYQTRVDFLHNLAWWQWSTNEIRTGDFWRWVRQWLED